MYSDKWKWLINTCLVIVNIIVVIIARPADLLLYTGYAAIIVIQPWDHCKYQPKGSN